VMGYLMYCIFRNREQQRPRALAGVDGRSVFLVSESVLSAAVSRIDPGGEPTPDIPRILSYKKVVESFHGDPEIGGVIPMRYGCLFEEEPGIIRFLKEHRRPYESLLKELEGCMEMGIRMIIDDCRLSIEGLKNHEIKPENRSLLERGENSDLSGKLKTSGKAYLAARKDHYAQKECLTEAGNEIAEQFRAALTGLFVKCKVETPSIFNRQSSIPGPDLAYRHRAKEKWNVEGAEVMANSNYGRARAGANLQSPMLSLYFLVPRKSIGKFREVFRRLSCAEPARLLLSGPWPPYNFVLPDHPYDRC
jgi:hypothetical protein